MIDKPSDVTYTLIDLNKNEIVEHGKNLSPCYPKEHALRELTQLYSSTRLKINPYNSDYKQNQSIDMNFIQKPLERKNKKKLNKQTSQNLDNKKITQTERKNQNLEKNSTTRSKKKKEKFQYRQSSRFRNQPRNDNKTFIPQSKILKKVEFQKPL